MSYDSKSRKDDIDRIISIVERLAGLDAKFDSFITEFIKNRDFDKIEIKEIITRLTLLEREGTVVMRDGLSAQHVALLKQEAAISLLENCYKDLLDKYVRLKWIIGSVTIIVVPILVSVVTLVLHRLLGF